MDKHLEAPLLKNLHQLGLTQKQIQDHVLRPDTTGEGLVQFELRLPSDGDPDKEPHLPPPFPGWFYHLDTDQLKTDLEAMLRKCLNGYSLQLRRYGKPIFSASWHMAVIAPDGAPNHPAGIPWTTAVPMHVASLSKLITAMAMTRLLEDHNISPDSHIWPYLPKYWTRGPGIDSITFRDLLNHRSGFVVPGAPGACDFMFMKDRVAHGASGLPGYLNMNYAICRILMTTIDAPWLFAPLTSTSDTYWDLATTRYYASYVNEYIFTPAGITSGFDHTDANALAYSPKGKTPGWNSGDLSNRCGAVGWHFSVDDLLIAMAVFRRYGSIVPPQNAQRMLERQFGIDAIRETKLGRVYAKGGFWSEGAGVTVEQCNAIFLPGGMELVILANSTYCADNTGFLGDVLDVIDRNVKVNWLKATVSAVATLLALGLITKKVRQKK